MIPKARSTIINPTQEKLLSFVAEMPNAQLTNSGNYNVMTKVKARSPESTFFVSDHEIERQRISSTEYRKIAKLQDEFISQIDMILIEGCIGSEKDIQVSSRLFIEKRYANIAAMLNQLLFPSCDYAYEEFTTIFTPGLSIDGYPNRRIITIDLENYVTRVIGSDYFGEAKKAGLRMWNKFIYDRGGLALHAGCKVYPDILGEEKLILIIGLSGTGKTTTTFRSQLDSLPVQDDFCALLPGGKVYTSENGCFAKTIGLDPANEPTIYNALKTPESWLENVSVSDGGEIDFLDGSNTTNGRGTFKLNKIPHRRPSNLPTTDIVVFLNRNFNVIPAVVKLKTEQAPAYFMLGETTGTSAGGTSEDGKFLRVPGTNPFFTGCDALQGNRFYDLLKSSPKTKVYLLNTGRVGGLEKNTLSKKIHIRDSAYCLEGIIQETINWEKEDDFGYFTAKKVVGIDDELLHPKHLYLRQRRESEYTQIVKRFQDERREYMNKFIGLHEHIKQSM